MPPLLKKFSCDHCQKSFAHKKSLTRHIQTMHSNTKHECDECGKTFKRLDNFKRHKQNHKKDDITISADSASSDDLFPPNIQVEHEEKINRVEKVAPPVEGYEDDTLALIKKHWTSVKTYSKCQKVMDILNIRLVQQKGDLLKMVRDWWKTRINCRVKINASPGYILKHKETGELRYFHASMNNHTVFDIPWLIKSTNDLEKFLTEICRKDILEQVRLQRPSTSWHIEIVTNLSLYFYKIKKIGKMGQAINLPSYIKDNHSLLSMDRERCNNTPYTDHLCFFRCLAVKLKCRCLSKCKCIRPNEKYARLLCKRYLKNEDITFSGFRGIGLGKLFALERMFKVCITVFTLEPSLTSNVIWSSKSKYRTKLNLVMHERHFSYIKRLDTFAKAYDCEECETSFAQLSNLKRHKCSTLKNRLKFPTKCYAPSPTIFEEIEDETSINVPQEDRFYPYRITYDIECYMPKTNLPSNTSKLEYTSHHELMSISVCSNVPGFTEPVCMVSDGDTSKLVAEFVEYLTAIGEESYSLLRVKYADVFKRLEKFIREREAIESKYSHKDFSTPEMHKSRNLENLGEKFVKYLRVIPVVGFNSQRYDVNVMKGPLMQHLFNAGKIDFTVKRENKMQCIQTAQFKFLDITNFIAPGFSYEKYLKAFDCSLQKGFFPYEYVDSLYKLMETELPSHIAFFSTLKNENISPDDYRYCQRVWKKNNMECLGDFLVWYNNLDVVPFLEAIEKQSMIYRDKGIDMLKDAITLPGLAVRWKFTEVDRKTFDVPLINEGNKDLHDTVKSNIVGGPSIIFHRYHEASITRIRERKYGSEAKFCERVMGVDANALYLWSIMQEMPTGSVIRRRCANRFKPEFTQKFGRKAWSCLEYIADRDGLYLEHMFNKGERRVGQHGLPVDGFCKETNTVYQFHGCFWHGHDCDKTKGIAINPVRGKPMTELLKDTVEKSKYIEALGYNLVTIFECQWEEYLSTHPSAKAFVEIFAKRQMMEDVEMFEKDIIEAIRDDKVFGMVECDVSVPDHSREKFSEMPPIFKNTTIGREHLSDHMKEYVADCDHLRQPQKMLVGSMSGKKILLLTPLAKWYLEKGLVITKVYQLAQYKPVACFEKFGESVSNARRAGDVDTTKSLIAETSKLIGNSVYGKTITNKERHRTIKYSADESKVSMMVTNAKFVCLEEICDDFYEITKEKQRIIMDTPVVLGFAVLQYAKLRMLQFYYDFMDRFVDRKDFQYVEMDTDSAYMALSGSLENVVKPCLKREFYSQYGKWFPKQFCSDHHREFIETKLNKGNWNMRDCCHTQFRFDRRTPGLFKEEFQGNGIVALNSKTYCCWGEAGNKLSSKGLSKRTNTLTRDQYLGVLTNRVPVVGTNKGFVFKEQQMLTYQQLRTGLTYFYAKRKVCEDGVTTLPID